MVLYISGIGIQNDNDWAEEFHNNTKKLTEPEFTLPPEMKINFDVTNMGLRSYNDYIKQPTLLKDISKFEIPVLILSGRNDIRPIWPAIQLANLLPKSQVVIFEKGNHFLWEQEPEKFTETISKWKVESYDIYLKE
jgi:proline iminopeptidase